MIGKTAVSPSISTNEMVTYTLTITNSGPISSTNVVLTDTLSLPARLITAPTASQGACSTVANPLLTCSYSEGKLIFSEPVSGTVELFIARVDTSAYNPLNFLETEEERTFYEAKEQTFFEEKDSYS